MYRVCGDQFPPPAHQLRRGRPRAVPRHSNVQGTNLPAPCTMYMVRPASDPDRTVRGTDLPVPYFDLDTVLPVSYYVKETGCLYHMYKIVLCLFHMYKVLSFMHHMYMVLAVPYYVQGTALPALNVRGTAGLACTNVQDTALPIPYYVWRTANIMT